MATIFRIKYNFNWQLTLFFILLFPFLLFLGKWQLDRAKEKEAIVNSLHGQQGLSPIDFTSFKKKLAASINTASTEEPFDYFRRVRVSGELKTDTYWLKENQVVDGRIGYNVIMIMEVSDGTQLLVDRGWVPGSPLRDYIPEIETPSGGIIVTGTLISPSDSKLIRESETSVKQWPHKILEVDITNMASQVDLLLYPKLLKIDADSVGALYVLWQPINMSPAKHIGYAFQWFIMALVLFVLYLHASTNLSSLIKNKN